MRVIGQRAGKKKITHPKKELEFNKYLEDAVTFEDFLVGIDIDLYEYERIFINVMRKKNHFISKRLDNKKQHDYLRYIAHQLATYGFRFTDISYFFMDEISSASIGKWAKNYKNEPLKQKPIQVEIPRDQECIPEDQSWTKIWNSDTIKDLLNIMLEHRIYLWHIHKKKILSIENAQKLKRESRKK